MKVNKKVLTTMAIAGATIGLGVTAANADTVTVQSGDTVSGLAEKYHTTIDEIQKENKLANVNLIYVGQQLQIENNQPKTVSQSNTENLQIPTSVSQNSNYNQEKMPTVATQSTPNVARQNSVVAPKVQQTNTSAATNQNATVNANYSSNVSGNDAAAKAWIAQHESSNNYNARNGQYIGKYQLSAGYLNGDYSPANQEKCADQYVAQRYGSWSNAKQHWLANGWY